MKILMLTVLLVPMAMIMAMETRAPFNEKPANIIEQATHIIKASSWYKERVCDEFIRAVKCGTFTDVAACLNDGADIHVPFSSDEDTALHYAALHDSGVTVDLLLARGADPRAMTVTGATASDLAFSEGYNEMAEQLLEASAQYAQRGISLQENDRLSESSFIIEGVLCRDLEDLEDLVLCPAPTHSLASSTSPVKASRTRYHRAMTATDDYGYAYDIVGNRFGEMPIDPK